MAIPSILQPVVNYLVQQGSIILLRGAEKAIGYLNGTDNSSNPLTQKDQDHISKQIHAATTGNKCWICGARGAVISKYLPKPAYAGPAQGKQMAKAIVDRGNSPVASLPITWICCHCKNFVCFNCTLTIPESSPIQFYEDTYCSTNCRDAHNTCPSCKEPRICRLDKVGSFEDERAEELWFCANPMCIDVGKTPMELINNG